MNFCFHLLKLLKFLKEKCRKSNNKVIIHCLAGISRSPTLAIAYLMKHLCLKSDEAYRYVKERRQTISPNFNFLGQLYEYEKIQQRQQQQLRLDNEKIEEKNEKKINLQVTKTSFQNTSTESSNNPDLTLFKINRKLHSRPESPPVQQNETTNPIPNKISKDSTTNQEPTNKYSPSLIPRKKQFIFKFNDPAPETSHTMASPQTNKINNICLIQSPSIYSLPSPSQAFSSFNLESPTTSKVLINSNNDNSNRPQLNTEQSQTPISNVVFRQVPKSFTLNLLCEFNNNNNNNNKEESKNNSEDLFNRLRRPTNLLMSPMSPLACKSDTDHSKTQTPVVNSLKRPSSILLGSNTNIQVLNPNLTTIAASCASSNSSMSSNKSPSDIAKDKCFESSFNTSNFNKPTSLSLTRTLSNTSSTSSACSCCSNNSTSSSICSTCSINNTTPASAVSQQQQQQQQPAQSQQQMKKMKLSPIQDRCVLNNFSSFNPSTISAPVSSKSFKFQPTLTLASSSPQQQVNTPSVTINHHNLINSFRISESRSYDAIKTIAEQSFVQLKDFNRRRENNNYDNEDMIIADNENEVNFMKDDDTNRLALISSSLNLLNSATINTNGPSVTKSSNSSSPKSGSNKNSLHGSIETMIEVS